MLVCIGQKRWSEQAETWPCVSLFMLFSEPRDVPLHCDFRMCWGKDSGKKRNAHSGKGCNRLWGTFRNTRDLISVYTTEDEPCIGLVSKNFSLAHGFAQTHEQRDRSRLVTRVLFLLRRNHRNISTWLPPGREELPGSARTSTGASHHRRRLCFALPLPPRSKPKENI